VACAGQQTPSAVTVASATPSAASSAAPSDALSAPTLAPVENETDAGAFVPPASTPELLAARDPRVTKQKALADDAAYLAAFDAERAGDRAGAREKYLAIVRATPPSKRLGEAYFGLGEIYLAEAASDPGKLDLAATAFERARAHLPAKHPLAAFAADRQALAVAARSAIRSRRATRAGP